MIAPGQKAIIQVIVTNRCDIRDCSNCTQMLPHQRERFDMTPENFRAAVRSLADWHGVVGVFGGNPCTHPQFPELCRIIAEEIPDKRRRGLWTNNLLGHGAIIRETFLPGGFFNLNVHDRSDAADEMRRELPGVSIFGENRKSWHSPVMMSLRDFVPDEAERQKLIEQCDVNLKWSGAIAQVNGELRAYFCEIAAAWDLVRGQDNGLPVEPGWWRWGMERFADQAKLCHDCGVPLKLRGHLDTDFVYDTSATNRQYVRVNVRRKAVVHDVLPGDRVRETTDYMRLRSR